MSEVRAAGGAVWRRRDDGGVDVLFIHRPKYDDWSLPKGKAEPGEPDERTAVREVDEETGIRVHLGPELARVEYTDRNGRSKSVRYWAMTPAGTDHDFVPNAEVDALEWLDIDEGARRLTYGRDHVVLDALREMLGD